jgi:hypothetical protein
MKLHARPCRRTQTVSVLPFFRAFYYFQAAGHVTGSMVNAAGVRLYEQQTMVHSLCKYIYSLQQFTNSSSKLGHQRLRHQVQSFVSKTEYCKSRIHAASFLFIETVPGSELAPQEVPASGQ